MSRIYMMVVITNRSRRNRLKEFFEEHEICQVLDAPGSGTANSEVLDYFGLEATEKNVYFSIVTDETWKRLRRSLIINLQIDIPGSGIAFTIPVSSIGGKNVLQFLTQGQEYEKEEESALTETKYELVVAIANQGSIDSVMDAARSGGSGGGTVLHAKGTGVEKAEKFLGVSLAKEKEVILIVTKKSQKDSIMKAIMDQCGLKEEERAIVFSLPVTGTAGIRMLEEDLD